MWQGQAPTSAATATQRPHDATAAASDAAAAAAATPCVQPAWRRAAQSSESTAPGPVPAMRLLSHARTPRVARTHTCMHAMRVRSLAVHVPQSRAGTLPHTPQGQTHGCV